MEIPQTRFVQTPEGRVAYQVLGEGPFDIAFVSEWVQNIDLIWDHLATAGLMRGLASMGRLICFDKRGHGVSDEVPRVLVPTLEHNLDDTRMVLDAVSSGQAVLFGEGLRGWVAIMFAATYPERVRALVLHNTHPRFLRDTDYPWGLPPDRRPVLSVNMSEPSAPVTTSSYWLLESPRV